MEGEGAFKRNGSRWLAEGVSSEGRVSLRVEDSTQTVQLYKCSGCFVVKGKAAAVSVLESTCELIVEDVISSLEVIGCKKTSVQVTGFVPCISIENSEQIRLFVSEKCQKAKVVSSSISGVSVQVGDGEQMLHIPEQFITKLETGETKANTLYV